jgi:hypothetical protein
MGCVCDFQGILNVFTTICTTVRFHHRHDPNNVSFDVSHLSVVYIGEAREFIEFVVGFNLRLRNCLRVPGL